MIDYATLYPWRNDYGERVIAHRDGAVSLLIVWDGLDGELMSSEDRNTAWHQLHTALEAVPRGYTTEWHLWREHDPRLARQYLDRTQHFVRAAAIATRIREDLANHVASVALSNTVGVVLTLGRKRGLALTATGALKRQGRAAEHLKAAARDVVRQLPGARIADTDEYRARIQQTIDRPRHVAGLSAPYEPRFDMADQLVARRPALHDARLDNGETYTRLGLIYLYPDAAPGWALELAGLPLPLHLVHIVQPTDRSGSLRRSERASNTATGLTMGGGGQETTGSKVAAERAWREEVAANGLGVQHSAYIVAFHGAPEQIDEAMRALAEALDSLGGTVRATANVQLPLWRLAAPGCGYRSPWLRLDHTATVASLLPVQVYGTGEPAPDMLRMGTGGQLVGLSYDPDSVNHSFTVAMTGGGKGVQKCAQIIETYPLGIDWYIMEVGTSYQWTVEALGGQYTRIDPDTQVVNPLPPPDVRRRVDEGDDAYMDLPIEVVTGTTRALAFLLTDGSRAELTRHEEAAAQAALRILYITEVDDQLEQPLLPNLQAELERGDCADNDHQVAAAKDMAINLQSFLSTSEGRIFQRPGNFELTTGIGGIDLKLVEQKAPSLVKFYLTFLSLQFQTRAFAQGRPARVLLDEMHRYVQLAPEIIGPLAKGLARMGRKDGGALDLVTQETEEIDAIEAAVVNQCPYQTYLYRHSAWDEIAERVSMPHHIKAIWRSWPYPEGLPYRPGLQRVGDHWYHLHLTFPRILLGLASSSPTDLAIKDEIAAETDDPYDRIERLEARKQQKKEARHAA